MKKLTKNIKRVSYFALAFVLAIASIFAFIPRESKVAQAADYNPQNKLFTFEGMPVNFGIYEYFSTAIGSGLYVPDNTILNFAIDEDGYFDLRLKYSAYIRGSGQTPYQNYGEFRFQLYNIFNASNSNFQLVRLFYENDSYNFGDFSFVYTAPQNSMFCDYYIQKPVSVYNSSLQLYEEQRVMSREYEGNLAVDTLGNAKYSLFEPTTLENENNRELLFYIGFSKSDTAEDTNIFSSVVFDYSPYAVSRFVYFPKQERDFFVTINLLTIKLYQNSLDKYYQIEIPVAYGSQPFKYTFDVVNGVVDVSNVNYINGYNAGYNAGYNDNYQSIYDEGYRAGDNAGYNRGYEKGAEANLTFFNFFSSIVDAPVKVFTDLFNFDIMGVNLTRFFLSVLSLCIITTVLRWFI